jgi:hypothetical protein
MSPAVLSAQAASALDLLVHVCRDRSGMRRVDQIALWPRLVSGAQPKLIWTHAHGLAEAARELRDRLLAAQVELPSLLIGPVR